MGRRILECRSMSIAIEEPDSDCRYFKVVSTHPRQGDHSYLWPRYSESLRGAKQKASLAIGRGRIEWAATPPSDGEKG